MAHDRAEADELPLTQDFMALMLGVHRPSITVTAGILQRAGVIRYSGGRVTVPDRASLEAASCECYGVVKSRFAKLLGNQGPERRVLWYDTVQSPRGCGRRHGA